MPRLDDRVKEFIVVQLACFDTPTQVSDSVKEEFNIVVTRGAVQYYNPESVAGRKLHQRYRDLFYATRKRFKDGEMDTPISHQQYRLRVMQKLANKAIEKGNGVLALQILEQAAKDHGGAYTNKREVTGKDGGPVAFTRITREIVRAPDNK